MGLLDRALGLRRAQSSRFAKAEVRHAPREPLATSYSVTSVPSCLKRPHLGVLVALREIFRPLAAATPLCDLVVSPFPFPR